MAAIVSEASKRSMAKNLIPRENHKRPDMAERCSVQTTPGDNSRYIQHSMAMWNWPTPDMQDPEQVAQRAGEYFALCNEDDMKPSVSGLALAFGMDRRRLREIALGMETQNAITHNIPPETRSTVKKAYQLLTIQMEDYMQNGKINPVAGIFLMKNNMDYKDQQEVVVSATHVLGEATSGEELQKKYLDVTTIDADP